MSVDADIRPVRLRTPSPDLVHIVCCDENLARCGLDVTLEPWNLDHSADQCVVCIEFDGTPCGAPDCPIGTPP